MGFQKKARQVEVSAGEELTPARFDELYSHGRNSAIWYATNMIKSSKEIKEKLYAKGFPKEDILKLPAKEPFNIVDAIIESLETSLYIDDELFAHRFAESRQRKKYGRGKVSMELRFRGIDEEMIEAVLDDVYSTTEALEEFISKELRLARNLEPWKLKQKILRKALTRGWDFEDSASVLEDLLEQMED